MKANMRPENASTKKHAKKSTKMSKPVEKENSKETSQRATLNTAIRKNTPKKNDTEVNDRVEGRFFRGSKSKSEVEGLPVKSLPAHLQADTDDETTLEAGYARLGVGDVDADKDRDGKDLKFQAELESKGN